MAMLAAPVAVQAAEVVYRIVEFNKSTADFILAPCGEIPANSSVYFENEYGATIGNRYNQIPNKRKSRPILGGMAGLHHQEYHLEPMLQQFDRSGRTDT